MNDMTPEELEERLAHLRAPASPGLDARVEQMLHGAARAGSPAAEAGASRPVEAVDRAKPAALQPDFEAAGSRSRIPPRISYGLAAAGVLVGVALVLLIQMGQRHWGLAHQVPIRISAIQGPVLVKHMGTASWEELSAASALRVGDQLWSGSASGINLTLKDNSLVTLNAGGVLSLKHYDGRMEFELTHGTMRAVLREGHPPFFVRTPQGRLEALGTEFTVSVE